MATFKTIIEQHYRRADGTYNVRIRVTHQRKVKLISTQFYVTSEDLNKKLELKTDYLIDATNDLLKRYRTTCNHIGERLRTMSVTEVVDALLKGYNSTAQFELDFIAFGRAYAKKQKEAGKESNAKAHTTALNSLVRYTGSETVDINQITTNFLQSYIEWACSTTTKKGKSPGGRAASLYLASIRVLHNRAKIVYNDEDRYLIRIKLSPFDRLKIPKPPTPKKRALTIDQIQKIIELPYKTNAGRPSKEFVRYNLAKDVFLLSLGLVGMNSADLFNCTSFNNDRITYNRMKTKDRRSDQAEISIRVEPQIKALVEKYRDKTGKRVFNFHQHYATANALNSAVNKLLKEIGNEINEESLQLYAARHSWATIARNDARIDMYTVHTALNHVDGSMKVTDMYIKKDHSIIDDANVTVLKLLDFTNFDTNEP